VLGGLTGDGDVDPGLEVVLVGEHGSVARDLRVVVAHAAGVLLTMVDHQATAEAALGRAGVDLLDLAHGGGVLGEVQRGGHRSSMRPLDLSRKRFR
jgi:hypothetical protein